MNWKITIIIEETWELCTADDYSHLWKVANTNLYPTNYNPENSRKPNSDLQNIPLIVWLIPSKFYYQVDLTFSHTIYEMIDLFPSLPFVTFSEFYWAFDKGFVFSVQLKWETE